MQDKLSPPWIELIPDKIMILTSISGATCNVGPAQLVYSGPSRGVNTLGAAICRSACGCGGPAGVRPVVYPRK